MQSVWVWYHQYRILIINVLISHVSGTTVKMTVLFFFRDGSLCNESDDEDEDDEIFGNPAKVNL